MKNAQMHITVIEFTCPECNQHIAEPKSGSHSWSLADGELPDYLDCESCGKTCKVPQIAKRLNG